MSGVAHTADATPWAALARQAQMRGEAEALVFPGSGERLTFRDWQARAGALAQALLRRGIGAGDRVALWAENRIEWPIVQLAAAAIGAVLVPINSHYRQEELHYSLAHSRAKALLLSPRFRQHDYLAMAEAVRADLPHLELLLPFGDPFQAFIAEAGPQTQPLPAVAADRVAALLYTSGTTGRPKGALLSHRAMLACAWQTSRRIGFRAGDRYCSIIPLFHCAGCILGLLGCLQNGAAYVGVPAFDPEAMFKLIEAERCTLLSGVPTSYIAMLDHPSRARYDLSSLRAGTCGGADADPTILARCAQEFPMPGLCQVYGQTESSTIIAAPASDDPRRWATVGPPLEGYDVRITDPQTGAPLPAGAIGQIEARGPMVMEGYADDPAASAETVDPEGWLKTGDLGFLDDSGYLTIAGGRLRDMIIRGGENIYPSEIEQLLATHPAVIEAAVIALPDRYYGEIVGAAIRFRGPPPTAAALADFVAGRLAKFKAPAKIFALDAFPLTASGKIRKNLLRQMATEGKLTALD